MPLWTPFAGTHVRQSVAASRTTDATTTSTTFVDLLTLDVTTAADATLLIWASYTVSFSATASKHAMLRLTVDGTEVLQAGEEEYTVGQSGGFVYRVTGLSEAAHTIALQWRIATAGDGTFRCRVATVEPEEAAIIAMEVDV